MYMHHFFKTINIDSFLYKHIYCINMLVYHGCLKSINPWARSDHTFWVYPKHIKLITQEWDTHLPAKEYCNNHREDGVSTYDPLMKQYVCLGHTTLDEDPK